MKPLEAQVLLSKPERIINFDQPLFERIKEAATGRSCALAEIAGKDSFAACLSVAQTGAHDLFVPTVVYSGTETGDWDAVFHNIDELSRRLNDGFEVDMTEPVLLGSPDWWHASAGRFVDIMSGRYGLSPTCIACHMYFHASRIPLANAIGATGIISGERVLHDRSRKLNQLPMALNSYRSIIAERDIVLELPLENISKGEEIAEIVGPDWSESSRQMKCVLGGNYLSVEGEVTAEDKNISRYLQEFLEPFTRKVLDSFEEGEISPDYHVIAASVLAEWGTT